ETHTHHPPGVAGARCTGCHMPVTVYMQRDPRHDHSFGRPDPELTLTLGVPHACNRCHQDRDAPWAAAPGRGGVSKDPGPATRRVIAAAIAGGRGGDPASGPDPLPLLASGGDPVRRASAARLLARFPTSSGVTPALIGAMHDPQPLVRTGAAWSIAQRPVLAP